MSEINFSSLASQRYLFFSSLELNYPELYKLADERLRKIATQINNYKSDTSHTNQDFNTFMNNYLNKMHAIAERLRKNELLYINEGLKTLKNNNQMSKKGAKALEQLKNGKINEQTYQGLIEALNRIKYNENIDKFSKTVSEQKENIKTVEDNLNKLKNVDIELYEEMRKNYIEKYGKYIKQYYSDLREKLKKEFNNARITQIQKMTEKINNTIKELQNSQEFQNILCDLWEEHPEETEIQLQNGEDFNKIINWIVASVLNDNSLTAKQLANNIISRIKIEGLQSLEQYADDQSFKGFIKNNRNKASNLEKILQNEKRLLAKFLHGLDNMEQIIHMVVPDEKQADDIIQTLLKIKKEVEEAPSSKKDKIYREYDAKLRKQFSGHTDFSNAKELLKLDNLKSSITKNTKETSLEEIGDLIRNKFSIRIKKSGLAELIALKNNKEKFINIIENDLPGSLNMKDDVFCAFSLASGLSTDLKNNNSALDEILNEFDQAYGKIWSTFISEYSQSSEGATDVSTAEQVYNNKIQETMIAYKNLLQKFPTLEKEIKEYMKSSTYVLDSISVKDYTLYNNKIGYHAGTLGALRTENNIVHSHALENIYKMYQLGGISPVDVQTMEVALLNCAPSSIGAKYKIKKSLEHYLLGGAALMVFDEGVGAAKNYLENMEKEIATILPKNLNLYFLNQAYVPASYIIESIYTNLSKFYSQELIENVGQFKNRNRVVITNNVTENIIPKSGTLEERFTAAANEAMNQIQIQFLFMAGMLDIFEGLSKAFQQQA